MNERKWYIVSAKERVLGRLATRIARLLMGKDRPDYLPHEDKGAFVIVTDADQIKLSGNKAVDKEYFFPSTRPGKSKTKTIREIREKHPDFIITHAVKGMLPKNKLASRMIKRLKVYSGSEHPHESQKPEEAKI